MSTEAAVASVEAGVAAGMWFEGLLGATAEARGVRFCCTCCCVRALNRGRVAPFCLRVRPTVSLESKHEEETFAAAETGTAEVRGV